MSAVRLLSKPACSTTLAGRESKCGGCAPLQHSTLFIVLYVLVAQLQLLDKRQPTLLQAFKLLRSLRRRLRPS